MAITFFMKYYFCNGNVQQKNATVEQVITIRNVSISGNEKSVRVAICSGLFILSLIYYFSSTNSYILKNGYSINIHSTKRAHFFVHRWLATNRWRNRKLHSWHNITHFDTRSPITTVASSSIVTHNTNCPLLYRTVPLSTPDIYRTYSENCCCVLVLHWNTAKRTNPCTKHFFHPFFTHYYLITHTPYT